jgi:hypothetical protein
MLQCLLHPAQILTKQAWQNHCWSSHPDRLWCNCYTYDMSYLMIHLIVDLRWGFLPKTSLWSNNHSCPNQTRNGTQAAGNPKVPFHLTSHHGLNLAHGFKSKLLIILVMARKPFSQWSDLRASTSICPRTAWLSPKNLLDDKLVFHLEILKNIILKVFPYLNDGSVSDLLRSCPRVPMIWRSLRSCPRLLALRRLTSNLMVW